MLVKVTLPSGVSARLDMIPTDVSKLAFVAAFLDAGQMRRLFNWRDSAEVCKELGLPVSKTETVNCQTIEAFYSKDIPDV